MEYNVDLIKEIIVQVLERFKEGSLAGDSPASEVSSGSVRNFSDITEYSLYEEVFIKDPIDIDFLKNIKKTTPARICLGRTGPRYLTIPWLRFRADHAAAMDAVFTEVSKEFLDKMGLFEVQTLCRNKDEYLTRPDLGKFLSEESKRVIKEKCSFSPQVQVIVVDGLSSKAIEENVPDFMRSFLEVSRGFGFGLGTPFFIRYGRVPVMNDVGEVLQADVVVELIGERPGLVTAKSMSAYLCWKPRLNTVESQRNVVSNIHDKGLPPLEAGAHVAEIVKRIIEQEKSGTDLVL